MRSSLMEMMYFCKLVANASHLNFFRCGTKWYSKSKCGEVIVPLCVIFNTKFNVFTPSFEYGIPKN